MRAWDIPAPVIAAGSTRQKHREVKVYSQLIRGAYTLPGVRGAGLLLSLFMGVTSSTDVDLTPAGHTK